MSLGRHCEVCSKLRGRRSKHNGRWITKTTLVLTKGKPRPLTTIASINAELAEERVDGGGGGGGGGGEGGGGGGEGRGGRGGRGGGGGGGGRRVTMMVNKNQNLQLWHAGFSS